MDTKWIRESPIMIGERETIPISIQFPHATAAVVDAHSLIVYHGSTDVTATVTSGSNTYSGNRITLKSLAGLTGGEVYILSILVALDGVSHEYRLQVECVKSSSETKGAWIVNYEIYQGARAATPYSLSFQQATSVTADSSGALKIYRNGTDVTATYASGSNVVSGRVVTTKTISGLTKGTYVCSLVATVDGVVTEVKWLIKSNNSFDNQ